MAKKKDKSEPAPVGRPSAYEPRFCEMVVKHMAEGLSFDAFAGVVGVSRQTLYTWTEKHEKFLDTKKKGEAKCLLWWEKEGKKGLWEETIKEQSKDGTIITKTKKLNTVNWLFNMKNRFRWADRQEIGLEANVTTNPLKEEMKKKSTEELLEIVNKAKVDE